MDANDNMFHSYVAPQLYHPYALLEIPLTVWEYQTWCNVALPHVPGIVRRGPLSIDGTTWPTLAGFTLYPNLANLNLAEKRVLYNQLGLLYRRLISLFPVLFWLALLGLVHLHRHNRL